MTSSSVGYGDFSAGRSGSGISSMRYTVPGALMPVAAVVMCTRASRLVCVTLGSSTIVGMRARWSMAGCGIVAPGIGAEDQRRVDVAADQQVDRRELARIEARIAAATG